MRPPAEISSNVPEFVAAWPRLASFKEEVESDRRGSRQSHIPALYWTEFLDIGAGEAHAVLLCNLLNGVDSSSYGEVAGKSYLAAIDRFGEPQLAVLRVPVKADFAELFFPFSGEVMRLKLNKEIDASISVHALADGENVYVNSENERILKLDKWPALFNAHDKYRFFRDAVVERETVDLPVDRKYPEISDPRIFADRICSRIEFGIREHRSADNPNRLTRINQAFRPALMEILSACEDACWGRVSGDSVALAVNNFQTNVAYGRIVVGRTFKHQLVDYNEIWTTLKNSKIFNSTNDRTEYGVAVLLADHCGVPTLWTLVVAVLPKEF